EAVVLEGRDAAEGLAFEIVGRRPARREGIDLDQAIGDAFLCERLAHDADIDAEGAAVDDGLAHVILARASATRSIALALASAVPENTSPRAASPSPTRPSHLTSMMKRFTAWATSPSPCDRLLRIG